MHYASLDPAEPLLSCGPADALMERAIDAALEGLNNLERQAREVARRFRTVAVTEARQGLVELVAATEQIVTLASAGMVTQAATAANNIEAASLELLGVGAYDLTNSANAVTTIATAGPGGVSYTDADGFAVGTVNSTVGMNVAGDITLTTLNSGALTINQDIATTNSGNVTLNNSGGLFVNADINADGDVIQNGAGSPAAFATFDHFSISLFTRSANCSGVLPTGSAPSRAMRVRTAGVLSICTSSPLTLPTTSLGVPAGANTPCHELIS